MPKSCQRRLLFLNPSLSIRTPKFGTASGLWHAFRGFILHEALHCCNCSACRKRVAGTFSRSSGMSSRSPGYRRRRCPGIRCCKRVSRPTAYFWQAGEEMEELRRRKRKPLIETPAAAPRGFRNLVRLGATPQSTPLLHSFRPGSFITTVSCGPRWQLTDRAERRAQTRGCGPPLSEWLSVGGGNSECIWTRVCELSLQKLPMYSINHQTISLNRHPFQSTKASNLPIWMSFDGHSRDIRRTCGNGIVRPCSHSAGE